MKTYQAIFIIISIILASQTYGYIAYDKYPMIGNVIFPLTDVDVNLSEINVLMESTSGIRIATKVTTEYMLENLSSKEINFKVGFAIEPYVMVTGESAKMPDDFKVLINNRIVKTSTSKIMSNDFYPRIHKALDLKNTGSQKNRRDDEIPLIIWEISFKPREKKIITTTYTLEWLADPGVEVLRLDLANLYLWKGNIDKAYFKLMLSENLMDDIKAKGPSRWPLISIEPPKYKIKDHALEWYFKNLKKEKIYHITIRVNHRKPGVVGD